MGGDGNDSLIGGVGSDVLYGGAGGDSLNGGADNDFLYGDGGLDSLYGGAGNDVLDGGDDNDYLSAGVGNDTLVGGLGVDSLYGGDGDDAMDGGDGGDGADYLKAGLGNDVLYGGLGNDTIYGNEGENFIDGGEGNDVLHAGIGFNETVMGGDGNDTIYSESGTGYNGYGVVMVDGGAGNDRLVGSSVERDVFLFNGDFGLDTVIGAANNPVGSVNDYLEFSVDHTQLWFAKSGSALNISVIGTNNQVSIANWYTGSGGLADVGASTSTGFSFLGVANVDALVSAMSSLSPPPMGQTTLTQAYMDVLGVTFSSLWGGPGIGNS